MDMMVFLESKPMFIFILFLLFTFSNALVFNSTALVIGIDATTANKASYILTGYGIGYETLLIPQVNTPLPNLESSDGGNYGLFVIYARAVFNGTSRLTDDQWESLWSYQRKYSVRMVHLNAIPNAGYFGAHTISSGGCCDTGIEQNVTLIENVAANEFPNAGVKNATVGSVGLYHYPASILDANSSTTEAFLNFQPNQNVTNITVAGVINRFDGREQMAFFMDTGNWSVTSAYLDHIWVQWGTRQLYQGYRRIYLSTQVDDLFLKTLIYTTNTTFRVRDTDLQNHISWTADLNSRLSEGSSYFTEFGFCANGNVIYASTNAANNSLSCGAPVFTSWEEPTELEFEKPLGSGINAWALSPQFTWTADCAFLDPLVRFFANTTNRDAVGLVSHTFTHLSLNNATYHDTLREIQFNLMYAELLNFTEAKWFSGSGLIPPAISGVHNGDAIRAWADNGLWNAVGDNSRPILRNPINQHWPLMTSFESNGYKNFHLTPRFATRIYYDCDVQDCDVAQWVGSGSGTTGGTFTDIINLERTASTHQLLSLYHDPYMFHQANIRSTDVEPIVLNGKSQNLSLLQIWVEIVVAEVMRLVTWPIITLKHDDIAQAFNERMVRDACGPYIQIITGDSTGSNNTGTQITGFKVGAETGNSCEVFVPFTVPGKLKDTQGWRVEQLGTDPLTVWVKLDGDIIEFELDEPVTM